MKKVDFMYSLMVKFFKDEKYLNNFRSGLLYSQTFEAFRKMETDNGTRYDPLEGLLQQKKIAAGKMQIRPFDKPNDSWKDLSFVNGIFSQFHKGNIFCLSRFELTPNDSIKELYIDSKFDEFGDYYVIIMDQIKFEDRLSKAIIKEKLNVSGRMVNYIDLSNFSGKASPFVKNYGFAWQSEFRYHFRTDLDKPLSLRIGDISDITEVGRLSASRTFQYKVPLNIELISN
jgi:hypothetical protein